MAMHTEVREKVKYASAQRRGVLWCHTGQEGAQHLERRVLFLIHNNFLSSSIESIRYYLCCIIGKSITLPYCQICLWQCESRWLKVSERCQQLVWRQVLSISQQPEKCGCEHNETQSERYQGGAR